MEDLQETLDTVRKIKKDMKRRMTRQQLYGKYSDFATNKPKTFALTLDGKFDEQQFTQIMNVYKDKKDETNNSFEASWHLGQTLADKWLYPSVGKPSDSELSEMKETARRQNQDPNHASNVMQAAQQPPK